MFLAWGPERISFHNDAYRPHLGTRADAIGRRADEVWPEVWPVVEPIVERAAAGESSWLDKLELTIERDGRDLRTWRTVSCSPVPDDDGSVGGVLWTVHDMTEAVERARAEARLQETLEELRISNERFNLAQEVGGIGSWEWNILTDEGWVSDTYKQMHGLSDVEGPLRIGQVIAVIHPDDLPGYQARLAAAKQRREPSTNEYRVVLPDGSIRWVGAKGRPIFGEDGALIGALGIVFDLTERKEAAAAEALRQALEAAERERLRADEANRAKSKFLAMISHDVRTPLNVVLGLASVLKPRLTDPAHTELVGEIESAGGMLLRLLNGVLDLSKIESGEVTAKPAPVDLCETLQTIAGVWRERVRELGLSLSVSLDGAPEHFRVVADGAKVEQTVINFLSNALKLTPAGCIEICARARPVDGGIALRIAVHDEGPGVPAEYREKVFEPFEQLAEGRAAGGAGLGLAICKANVQALGGRIGVDDKPGRGAVFWFEFTAPQGELVDAAPEPPAEATQRRLKVLAAEDHPGNRRLLSLVLDQLGADVVLAENGAEAVSACAEADYGLVLMDAMMPVMDGVSALAAIRAAEQQSQGRRVPVFMLTANVFDEDVARYLAAGADGVLRKPLELPELAGVLERVRQGRFAGEAA
jgi:PAS domain S-box-containing protein